MYSMSGCTVALSISLVLLGFLLQREFNAAPVMQEFAAKDFDRFEADIVRVFDSSLRREKAGVIGSKMIYASILNFNRINEDVAKLDQAKELISDISMSDEARLMGQRALQLQKDELRSMQLPYEVYLRAVVVNQFISQAGRDNTPEDILNGLSTHFDKYVVSRDQLNNYNKKLSAKYPLWSWLLVSSGLINT